MSFAPHRQHLRIDSATVILNQNAQAVCFICDFHFDPLCVRVPKRVDYSFSANVVDFVANERMQWPVPAFNDHAKMDLLVKGVFLLDPDPHQHVRTSEGLGEHFGLVPRLAP